MRDGSENMRGGSGNNGIYASVRFKKLAVCLCVFVKRKCVFNGVYASLRVVKVNICAYSKGKSRNDLVLSNN